MKFLMEYGNTILYTVIMAIVSYVGLVIKNRITRFYMFLEEKEVAKTCVNAVNKIYKNKTNKERYNLALKNIDILLKERNINISELEAKMLISEVCKSMDCEGIENI